MNARHATCMGGGTEGDEMREETIRPTRELPSRHRFYMSLLYAWCRAGLLRCVCFLLRSFSRGNLRYGSFGWHSVWVPSDGVRSGSMRVLRFIRAAFGLGSLNDVRSGSMRFFLFSCGVRWRFLQFFFSYGFIGFFHAAVWFDVDFFLLVSPFSIMYQVK